MFSIRRRFVFVKPKDRRRETSLQVYRVECSKPFAVEETTFLNKFLDSCRPREYPPRSKARFYWSWILDALYWAEMCVRDGGTARIHLVELDLGNGKCIACDFDRIDDVIATGSKEACRAYWQSCKPYTGGIIENHEILCWNTREVSRGLPFMMGLHPS